jgi:hypothetical protein
MPTCFYLSHPAGCDCCAAAPAPTITWPWLLRGPLCEEATALDGCYHPSCTALVLDGRIHLAIGPLCDSADYLGDCRHPSCTAIEPAQGKCARHGWQLVLDAGSGSGFAGGRIWWATLACGCTDMDESGDVEAAR